MDQIISARFNEGKTVSEIAAELSIPYQRVRGALKRLGLAKNKAYEGYRQRRDDDKFRELWGLGLCATQIAERLKIPANSAYQMVSRLKLSDGHKRHRYDGSAPGGSGRSGFAAAARGRT